MFLEIDFASVKNVGRVGALAVALGIGGAVSFTPVVARADDSPSSESSASTSESSSANEGHTAGQRGGGGDRTPRSRTVPPVSSGATTGFRRGTGAVDLPAPAAAVDPLGSGRSSHHSSGGSLPGTVEATTIPDAPALTRLVTPPVPAAASPALPAASVPIQHARPAAVAIAQSVLPAALAVAQSVLPAAFAVAQPAPVSTRSAVTSIRSLYPRSLLFGDGIGASTGPLNFVAAALSLISQEISRLKFNSGQTARPVLSSQAAAAATSSPSVTYSVGDNWGAGFIGNMAVNAGSAGLKGWTVSFNTPAQITNVWNGVITSHVGDAYVVTNATWNAQVAATQSTSFGFQATPGGTGTAVTGLQLNGVASTPTVTTPGASVVGVTAAEPTAGATSTANFAVTLSKASTTPVSIGYATSNGTATAGVDYTATSGTLSFAPGVTSQQIKVPVLADATVETNETFTVTLSKPVGATLTTATATGTITNTPVAPVPSTGTTYSITATGPDIVGFNPAKDKLDLGDVSVHNFIVVDTADGVGFRSPWTGETAVLQGVSLGQLTVDNFAPIINDHLRQDLSGALAWEHGITAAPNTVYVRSHEVGQVDTVAFNPATDVVDFRYYGTREQIYLTDSPDGVILGNAGTGQALILKGVTKSQLTATNFVFHFAQVREDSLYKQLGFTAMPDSQIKPQGVPIAGTNVWPTAAGNGTPPAGQTGTTTVIAWKYGINTAVAFDPSKDKLDFGWFKAPEFDVTDASGSTKISIVGNNQTYTLTGVTLGQLQTGNIIALDSGARTKWQGLIFGAAPATPLPTLSVADRSAAEGNTGTSTMNFTVLMSQAAAKAVSVGYTTSNDTATAGDYAPTVGTLTFAPGETSKTVSVAVNGDTMVELNEQFTLNLSNAVNATIADATATGTIVNDDIDLSPLTPPKVSIADLAVTEGNGEHSHFMFSLTLDKASATPVSVGYATANGTATAGVDYTAGAGTVTFASGVTTQTVHVDILGDTAIEPNETFAVTLSNPLGLTIARATAIGTILNDDVAAPPTPGLSISDASATEPGSGGMAPGFLHTAGNQIVDSQGKTVAISGVNWFGMESTTQAPHGLWTRSYKDMINQMVGLGFNTIRLPFSSELLHTTAAPNGIDFSKNPDLQGLSGLQVMDAIVAYAGQQGMRVILDHHRSGAGAGTSDNGLWYDSKYTEDAWVADWATLATRYQNNPTVIGVDLHNEPHNGTWGGGGATDWARAAERAGNAALAANPNLLVFVEGVESYKGQNYWWGGNLMGVKDRPIVLNVANHLVYSPHDYPNSVFPQSWFQTADFGAGLPAKFRQMWGYIYEQNIAPVYIGEFGTKLSDPKDAIWLEALTSYISGDLNNDGTKDIPAGAQDISWTYWSWNPNSGDTGGILADDWTTVNQNKMAYLTPIEFTAAGGSSLATFTVTLSSASTQPVTVAYTTSNGTATSGSDYTASAGTIAFAPGETTKTIAIIVNGDATAESAETFTVTLSSPSGATLVDGSGAGTIKDRPSAAATL